MVARRPALPAGDQIAALVERLIPGRSESVVELRQRIFDFSSNLSARTVLLRGPIGAGKSTVARAIGFLKRIAPLTREKVKWHLDHLRYETPGRIDIKLMPWFVELPLTGLVEELADTQLFGHVEGAFSGARGAKPGAFERAASGSGMSGEAGSRITGGVVFLDEIGDLRESLQAKLLPVLSGGVFYRVGPEDGRNPPQTYEGVTITASWRLLEDQIRPDLLSRISAYTINVPGIAERREDLPNIVEAIQAAIVEAFKRRIAALGIADPAIDHQYLRHLSESIRLLDETSMRLLVGADWERLGNLRGLTSAIERIVLGGEEPKRVVDALTPISHRGDSTMPDARAIVRRLSARAPDGFGLAQHLRAIELEDRRRLRALLGEDGAARSTIADALRIPEDHLATQVQQLDRSRRRARRRRQP